MALAKPRVVGFVALGAVAAIVIPMLFDGQGVRESRLTVTIPPQPQLPVMQVAQPQQPRLPDTRQVAEPVPERIEARQARMTMATDVDEESTEAASQQDTSKAKVASLIESASASSQSLSLKDEVPRLDQQGVPVAWTLQLAAFKDRGNAEGLRDRLIKAGYKAYVREKSALTRVFVGPEVQRERLEQLKLQFQREMKLEGLILRFTTG